MDKQSYNKLEEQPETTVLSGKVVHVAYPARKTNYAIGTLYWGDKKINFEIPRAQGLEMLGSEVKVEGQLRKFNSYAPNEYYLLVNDMQEV